MEKRPADRLLGIFRSLTEKHDRSYYAGMSKGVTTRDRIVERAFSIATVDGLNGLTLGRLAEDVGMSKSGLFAHFRSKEELDLAILAAAVEKFTDIVIKPALAAPRGEPRVHALFDGWLLWDRHKGRPPPSPLPWRSGQLILASK